jgi:thiol peroxidase
MATVTLKGTPFKTNSELPKVGAKAPDFKLVRNDLSEVSLASFGSKKKVLSIFPSIDTPTCATSVRQFNQQAASVPHTVILNISLDLPFAQKRFCGAEGITNCETLSAFRSQFASDYGVRLQEGPLLGLTARAVIVLDEDNKVLYTELVPEIANEPNYKAALAALNNR